MAAYINFNPKDYFNPVAYTGTGSELAVTGVGFQPDMTWLKSSSIVKITIFMIVSEVQQKI